MQLVPETSLSCCRKGKYAHYWKFVTPSAKYFWPQPSSINIPSFVANTEFFLLKVVNFYN